MNKPYSCSECDASFTRRFNLARHKESYHPELYHGESNDSETMSDSEKPYPCLDCNASFTSSYNLRRHEKRKHESESDNEDDDSDDSHEDDDGESNDKDDDTDSDNDDDDDDEVDASDNDNESVNMSVSNDSDEEENESSDEDNESDALQRMVSSVLNDHSDEFYAIVEGYQDTDLTPKEAAGKAFEALRPVYKKSLKRYVVNYITLSSQLQRTPLFKSIFRKIKHLKDDGLGEEEAIQLAVSYRKYSLYDLLQSYLNDHLRNIETDEDN